MNKSVFFIGIKGVGMTALALAMQDKSYTVLGSDTGESFITDEILEKRGIAVSTPITAPVPPGTDLIVYSGAYEPPSTTHDLQSIPLAQALADFVSGRKVIAVAGVGGKTTTSAMLAALFTSIGKDVGYYVGTGSIAGLKAPGANGSDPWYVVESDEYAVGKSDHRPKFALLSPQIVVTTNIIHDHPDIYPDVAATLATFRGLIERIPKSGAWICRADDPLTAEILKSNPPKCHIVTYSTKHPLFATLKLSVFGDQNKLDATAATLAAIAAGVPEDDAIGGIQAYKGAGRRQESHGEVAGRLLYDDYGHHPKEVELTVQSFKDRFPGHRVLLVFESHTYTRTEALLSDFASAIALADIPFIMPIFESAREHGQSHTVTPESFAKEVAKHNKEARAVTWENAADIVWETSRPGDIILTMGAGFVYKLHEKFKLH